MLRICAELIDFLLVLLDKLFFCWICQSLQHRWAPGAITERRREEDHIFNLGPFFYFFSLALWFWAERVEYLKKLGAFFFFSFGIFFSAFRFRFRSFFFFFGEYVYEFEEK